ncbi:hypothetical protein AVEN_20697-1 [Araneus ventricosus]|uniref:Uncharacterized protein n=1 Tax=Araneus ventricosus TaxID=182803 RepID=A0A4Y2KGQ3_ARAVE|nr:hypothetical protein AVEN_20697-1 [Araneus ventricosus]
MKRTTPELAPPLQTSAPHQREDVWPPTYDLTCPIRDRSSVEFQLSDPEVKTLPLGHHSLIKVRIIKETAAPCLNILVTDKRPAVMTEI